MGHTTKFGPELVRGASGASRASMRMGQTLIFISRDENKCSPCIYTQKNTKIVGARDYKPLCWLVGWLVHPLSLITKRLWLWALLNINFFYQTFFWKRFFLTKIFLTKNFLNKNFFDKIFFFWQKFFLTKIFFNQNFFWKKIFWTKIFFWIKIFLRTKLFFN